MTATLRSDSWLSFALAFVGGYCDAASYVLAKTFTGHITGTLVLAAISAASLDWRTLLRHILAIALFLIGVVVSLLSGRFTVKISSRFLLPVVMCIEIVLISTAYLALTSHLTIRFGLFISCMSLALGLQNGAFTRAGGVSVHTTYLTGTITSLLKIETQKYSSETITGDDLTDQKVKVFGGIWLTFALGATAGAAMVFWLRALGVVGAALLLLAIAIGQFSSQRHSAERNPNLSRQLRSIFLLCCAFLGSAFPANSQILQEETLSGPDSHETGQGPHGHLLGNWGGERTRLLERGVRFDFQYISDSLWDIKSEQKERFASWNRFRGTVDIDFGVLTSLRGLFFHATALWQGGGNLGAYLGLLTSPSGMSSANTCRLDSWWFEKRWLDERIAARVGQFAGQDFYGAQHYAASFIFEPMGYALGNLFADLESFDPPSTPAMEVRVVPVQHLYVKSMVLAAVSAPFSQNSTGLVPQFNGTPMSVSEIGFTPGKKASSVRAFDNVETRKGYSGLYQFGASYNPAKFTSPSSAKPQSGNYLLYWMASQAVWRVDPKGGKGLDATFAYDWSPPRLDGNNRELAAGLRFNEPLPVNFHNTVSLGYVRNMLSPQFFPPGKPAKTEQAVEFNTLLDPLPMLLLQPVIQYYSNVGGGAHRAVVLGFRTKVEF